MRNYFEVWIVCFHFHFENVGDVDGLWWAENEDDMLKITQEQTDAWTQAGWTVTVTFQMPVYWHFTKATFARFLKAIEQSQNILDPSNPFNDQWSASGSWFPIQTKLIEFESPRGKERRKFYLVPRFKDR